MVGLTLLNVRKDFPFFEQDFVYLDSAATTQKPKVVLDAMREFYEKHNANVHRGVYSLAEEATQQYEGAREKVARLINASAKELVFVRNATEAINLVALSWGAQNIGKDDVVLLTEMEHHSNIVPWQMLAKKTGAKLVYIPLTESGELDQNTIRHELAKKPKLFAFTHISNVLGTVNPAKDLITEAHKHDVPVLLDAAQSVPHMPVDVRDLDCDFLVFSGHKMYGPEVGVLYAKRILLEAMPPVLGGGEMIKSVSLTESTWNEVPWKFEAGTPNIAGAIGLGAAAGYLMKIGMKEIWAHEQMLLQYAYEFLRDDDLVCTYGPEKGAGIISFNFQRHQFFIQGSQSNFIKHTEIC